MITPCFEFTSYKNSFCVFVNNLEELSVDTIKKIENFVKERNGLFDFNSYSFVIQKRVEFNEFVKLLQNTTLKATCIEKFIVKKQLLRIGFGQYKGVFYNELPDSYLLWLKGNYSGKDRDIIHKELKTRTL